MVMDTELFTRLHRLLDGKHRVPDVLASLMTLIDLRSSERAVAYHHAILVVSDESC